MLFRSASYCTTAFGAVVRHWLLKFAVMHNVAFPGVHQSGSAALRSSRLAAAAAGLDHDRSGRVANLLRRLANVRGRCRGPSRRVEIPGVGKVSGVPVGEVLEPIRCQLGVPNGVLNVFVAEPAAEGSIDFTTWTFR